MDHFGGLDVSVKETWQETVEAALNFRNTDDL